MTRLLDFCGLMLVGLAFAASLVVAASFESNLPLAVIAGGFAALCAFAAHKINQRVKVRSVEPPITLPAEFPTPLKAYRSKGWLLWLAVGAVFFGAPAYLLLGGELLSGKERFLAVGGGLVALCLILLIVWELRMVGTPALIVDERGVTTPDFGLISWSEIDRAAVQVREANSTKVYWLALSVYQPKKYFARLNPVSRWLSRLDLPMTRDDIKIRLNFLSHKPAYLAAAIDHVRAKYAASIGVKLRTGDLSIDSRFSEMDKLMQGLRAEDSTAKVETTLEKVRKLGEQSLDEIRQDAKKAKASALYPLLILVAITVLYLGWWLYAR